MFQGWLTGSDLITMSNSSSFFFPSSIFFYWIFYCFYFSILFFNIWLILYWSSQFVSICFLQGYRNLKQTYRYLVSAQFCEHLLLLSYHKIKIVFLKKTKLLNSVEPMTRVTDIMVKLRSPNQSNMLPSQYLKKISS